jgi:hypothetical protein
VNVQCLAGVVPTGAAPGSANPAGGNYATANTVPTQTCTQYRYSSFANPSITVQNQNRQSLYQIRVGVRFVF